jgi:hypothetical protein
LGGAVGTKGGQAADRGDQPPFEKSSSIHNTGNSLAPPSNHPRFKLFASFMQMKKPWSSTPQLYELVKFLRAGFAIAPR